MSWKKRTAVEWLRGALSWAYQWEHLDGEQLSWVWNDGQKSEPKAFPSRGYWKNKNPEAGTSEERKTANAEVSTMERWRAGVSHPAPWQMRWRSWGFCLHVHREASGRFQARRGMIWFMSHKKTLAPKWWMDLYYITLIIIIILIIGDESKSKGEQSEAFPVTMTQTLCALPTAQLYLFCTYLFWVQASMSQSSKTNTPLSLSSPCPAPCPAHILLLMFSC